MRSVLVRSGYTAIGEQVGLAQRMESVAPPGGVMLSESTARLVERAAVLGEPQMVDNQGRIRPSTRTSVVGELQRTRDGSVSSETTLVGRPVGNRWPGAGFSQSINQQFSVTGRAGIGEGSAH